MKYFKHVLIWQKGIPLKRVSNTGLFGLGIPLKEAPKESINKIEKKYYADGPERVEVHVIIEGKELTSELAKKFYAAFEEMMREYSADESTLQIARVSIFNKV